MEESDPEFEAEYQAELKRIKLQKARDKARRDYHNKHGRRQPPYYEQGRLITDLDDAHRSPEETQELIDKMKQKYGIDISPETKKAKTFADSPSCDSPEPTRTLLRQFLAALFD